MRPEHEVPGRYLSSPKTRPLKTLVQTAIRHESVQIALFDAAADPGGDSEDSVIVYGKGARR